MGCGLPGNWLGPPCPIPLSPLQVGQVPVSSRAVLLAPSLTSSQRSCRYLGHGSMYSLEFRAVLLPINHPLISPGHD